MGISAGSRIAETLAAALLRGKERWNDPSYLARIIFSEMIQDSVLDETGYGLSNVECDNGPARVFYAGKVVKLPRWQLP